jgi:hypothetical protein
MSYQFESDGLIGEGYPTTPVSQPRLLLPVILAVLAIQGSLLPWVTIREFNGDASTYNLLDVKAGTSILITISALAIIGALVAMFKRITGLTIMSLAIASLGWMAAISGALLGILGSLLPSVNVAGLDLTRASVGQGSGVTITIVASFSLAFIIVRQLPPIDMYSPKSHLSLLPLIALLPLIFIAINMHSEWMILGSEETNYQAIIAGDSLYGSGLLVLVLWMNVGTWISAVIIQKPLVAKFAGLISILVSIVVAAYAMFLWVGGNALSWLIPSNVDEWAKVSIEPITYLVGLSAFSLLVIGCLSFFPAVQGKSLGIAERGKIGNTRVHTSDLTAVLLVAVILLGAVYRLAT